MGILIAIFITSEEGFSHLPSAVSVLYNCSTFSTKVHIESHVVKKSPFNMHSN